MRATILVGWSAFLAGCNGSEARGPAPANPPDAAPASSATTASGTAPSSSGAAASECSGDADCKTFSSYCTEAPCGCKALPKSAPNPTCAGTQVSCFVDPCASKAAACQGGRCELVMKR